MQKTKRASNRLDDPEMGQTLSQAQPMSVQEAEEIDLSDDDDNSGVKVQLPPRPHRAAIGASSSNQQISKSSQLKSPRSRLAQSDSQFNVLQMVQEVANDENIRELTAREHMASPRPTASQQASG